MNFSILYYQWTESQIPTNERGYKGAQDKKMSET